MTSYKEIYEDCVDFGKRPATFNMRVGMVDAMIHLGSDVKENLYLLLISVQHLLTGRYCPNQTGLNDFEVQVGRSPGFLCWFLRQILYFC